MRKDRCHWVVLVVVLILAAFLPGPLEAGAPKPGGTLKFALLRNPNGWDPHIYQGVTTYSFMNSIYETLIRYSPKGTLEPGLAARWETPDPATYVLHLRRNVKFHSGNPFTAEDVKYSLERILDPNTAATLSKQFSVVQSVTVVDPFTVRITLKRPDAPFLDVLASGEAVIADKKWAQTGGNFKQATSGTGPFKQGPFEAGVRYALLKNPDYWEQPYPYLDRIEFASIPKDEVRMQALQTGSVDMTEYIPWQFIKTLEKDPNVRLFVGHSVFNIIRLNPKRPPFDNVKVRQAFNYLIDRKEIVDLAWGGMSRPMEAALIPEGHWAYPNLHVWSYDPAKGKRLLAEAGVNPATTKIVLDSTTLSVHIDDAQIVVTQLQKAGFTQVELKTMDVPTQQKKQVSGDYQMFLDGFSLPFPDPDVYSVWFSSSGPMYARSVGFADEKLDTLLDQGRSTLDEGKRKAIYAQVEERLMELAPWVFLHWRPMGEATRANVKGYVRLPGALGNKSLGGLKYLYKEQ